jgi:hypothetical protein
MPDYSVDQELSVVRGGLTYEVCLAKNVVHLQNE